MKVRGAVAFLQNFLVGGLEEAITDVVPEKLETQPGTKSKGTNEDKPVKRFGQIFEGHFVLSVASSLLRAESLQGRLRSIVDDGCDGDLRFKSSGNIQFFDGH